MSDNIFAVITNVANDLDINVLTQSTRDDSCDFGELTDIVTDVLESLDENQSSESPYSLISVLASMSYVSSATAPY